MFVWDKDPFKFLQTDKSFLNSCARFSNVLEEGVEVQLKQVDFILKVVAPLDHHVV